MFYSYFLQSLKKIKSMALGAQRALMDMVINLGVLRPFKDYHGRSDTTICQTLMRTTTIAKEVSDRNGVILLKLHQSLE